MATEQKAEKIDELNNIFGELIQDAKTFSKDMLSGIYTYYFAGLISIIFGIQTGWYNRTQILAWDIIPLILVIVQIVVGFIMISRGFILKKKYSSIFNLENRL